MVFSKNRAFNWMSIRNRIIRSIVVLQKRKRKGLAELLPDDRKYFTRWLISLLFSHINPLIHTLLNCGFSRENYGKTIIQRWTNADPLYTSATIRKIAKLTPLQDGEGGGGGEKRYNAVIKVLMIKSGASGSGLRNINEDVFALVNLGFTSAETSAELRFLLWCELPLGTKSNHPFHRGISYK